MIARLRADAEELYGNKLCAIAPASERSGGFERDDGASVRKAFDGMKSEMEEAGKNHRKVAESIRKLVVGPFSAWSDAHEGRVNDSHEELHALIKAYDKQHELVKKLRSHYFNKCRLVEDMEEETKFIHVPPPDTPGSASSKTPKIKLSETDENETEDEALEIGDDYMQPSAVKKMLAGMLEGITLGEVKVAILGTYQNVATGDMIVEYIMNKMSASSVSYAERIGQDLVTHGFLRLVGSVGSTFANTSKMHYQFRPKAFEWAGVNPTPANKLTRAATIQMNGDASETASPTIAYVGDYLGNLLNNQYPNETSGDRLRREARETDDKYKTGVKQLDLMRCHLEESMMDHLKFMERCELDRLKAIKSVILDFSGAISNVIPAIQSTVDKLMLYQETVQPLGDLRYLLESYRTGSYMPKVITYESYYNTPDEQSFGVDLEVRARADRKRVPVIVTSILTYLDHHYPDLEGDEARRGIWLVDVPLAATHHLRNAINNGKAPPKEILANYEIPIVASLLKLYLLELPDSLVSSQKYEIIKTVYNNHGAEGNENERLAVIQHTLGNLPLTNIATLDAITTHFTRLIELTSADEAFVGALAHSLTYCILRPRVESSLTQHERHSYRLIRDLFTFKDQIFGELKRASSAISRPRAMSTDESQRRAHVEERNRAVIGAAKSRSSSPAAPIRTTNPLSMSPPIGSPRRGSGRFMQRGSLDVPSVLGALQQHEISNKIESAVDHTVDHDELQSSPKSSPKVPAAAVAERIEGLEKRNSLNRSAPVTSGRYPRRNTNLVRSVASAPKRDSVISDTYLDAEEAPYSAIEPASQRLEGVTLSDKPMDD